MDWITEPDREIPIAADVDLLVCGGGFAGVAAAVCAAKTGARVLLLERYGFLGGLVTAALVITTPPLDNGINLEIATRLARRDVYVPCRSSGEEVKDLHLHAMDPEMVKYEFIRMLQEQGVKILLHTYIVDTLVEGRVLKGIIVESKAGRQAVLAKVVVDATGDADVAASVGAPCRSTKKPMTMMFNMVGVDVERVLAEFGTWSGIKRVVKEAVEQGQLPFDLGIHPEFGSPGVYAEKLVYEDELNVWSGNLLGMNGLDPRDLTQGEIITREHVMRLATFLRKNVPGFEKARIEYTATQVGVRATRQIIGEASPSMDEVRAEEFPDTVVKPYAGWDMRLPYGSLLPKGVENLLVAGRCISAQEEAMGQLRLIPVCSATGQAAGVAAGLALEAGVRPRDLDISLLQEELVEQGMAL